MAKPPVDRRTFLAGGVAIAGVAGAAAAELHDGELGAPPQTIKGALPYTEGAADQPPGVDGTNFKFFTDEERHFIESAVDRLIPPSEVGPSAVEANVPFFLDRQLAGPFGRGDHYYLGGPWKKGAPEQGYQLRFSPAQLYRAAIAAGDAYVMSRFSVPSFAHLGSTDQDHMLRDLEAGSIQLEGGVESKSFFALLLQNTKEG